MGYTHYWERLEVLARRHFAVASEDCRRLCAALAIPLGDAEGLNQPTFNTTRSTSTATSRALAATAHTRASSSSVSASPNIRRTRPAAAGGSTSARPTANPTTCACRAA